MNNLLILIGIIILGFVTLYHILKLKFTEIRRTEVATLKNDTPSIAEDGTDKPFNYIGTIPGLTGERVYIERKDKYVFNKLVNTEFSIRQSWYDNDDYWD